jgi:hypothetical protein
MVDMQPLYSCATAPLALISIGGAFLALASVNVFGDAASIEMVQSPYLKKRRPVPVRTRVVIVPNS